MSLEVYVADSVLISVFVIWYRPTIPQDSIAMLLFVGVNESPHLGWYGIVVVFRSCCCCRGLVTSPGLPYCWPAQIWIECSWFSLKVQVRRCWWLLLVGMHCVCCSDQTSNLPCVGAAVWAELLPMPHEPHLLWLPQLLTLHTFSGGHRHIEIENVLLMCTSYIT